MRKQNKRIALSSRFARLEPLEPRLPLDGQAESVVAAISSQTDLIASDLSGLVMTWNGATYSLGPARATDVLAEALPTVDIAATDANAAKTGSNTGTFTVTRSDTNGDLVVNYNISGTAVGKSDYLPLPGSVTIPNGQTSATITLRPIDYQAAFAAHPTATSILVRPDNSATPFIAALNTPAGRADALRDAMAAASSGDVVLLAATTFDLGITEVLLVPEGVAMIGAGMEKTTLSSSMSASNADCFVALSSNCLVQDLKIHATAEGYGQSPMGRVGTVTVTNAVVRNVWMVGESDCVYVWTTPSHPFTAQFYNCRFDSKYDQVAVLGSSYAGHVLDFYNCQLTGIGPSTQATNTIVNCVNNRSGLVRLYDCTLTAIGTNFSTQTVGIWNQPGNSQVTTEAYNCDFRVSAGAGIIVDALNESGNQKISGGTGSGPNESFLINGAVTIETGGPLSYQSSSEPSETVTLTLTPSPSYTIGAAASATATILANDAPSLLDFSADPAWTGLHRTSLGNNYGWSEATNIAGGALGEAGGTFARALSDSYYGDTFLSRTFSLNDTIAAFGKFDVTNITAGWAGSGDSGFFLGHFSGDPANHEFIGLEFDDDPADLTNQLRVRARLQTPNGVGGVASDWINVSADGNHNFSYVYDPTVGQGQLLVTIGSNPPLIVNLSASERNSGAVFNAFGMGFTSTLNDENAPTKTAQAFLDDIRYSGYQPAITVVASDSVAAESSANPGVFTISRTNPGGSLTVSYLIAGKATAGADYTPLPSSITIPDGQLSATLTVTPLDDGVDEPNELVIVTLIAGRGYNLGTPYSAVVSIADND